MQPDDPKLKDHLPLFESWCEQRGLPTDRQRDPMKRAGYRSEFTYHAYLGYLLALQSTGKVRK